MRFFSVILLASTALALPEAQPQDTPRVEPRPCGFKIAPCPVGTVCRANDPECPPIRGENCAGRCIPTKLPPITEEPTPLPTPTVTRRTTKTPTPTYAPCGGFRPSPISCPKGQICVDDPRIGGCGMACDGPGICVTPEFCGGFAGFPCKDKNKICIDDPRDDCDPRRGGADCGGICV